MFRTYWEIPYLLNQIFVDGSEVQDSKPHLYGSTKYGDNVEDEWFVICLIYELSKNAGITARVWDSDGEILLIQAAYALPR